MLYTLRGISWEDSLADSKHPFDTLEIFPLCLIIKDMSNLTCEDTRSATTLVNAHHGHSHGPWCVTNSKFNVLIMSPNVLFH